MAASVMPQRAVALAVLFAGFGLPVQATDALNDPTRNPLLGRGDDAPSAAPVAPAPPTRLQMIVRGPGETRRAVIDGTKVGVGDTLTVRGGRARVERITETTVVLARGNVREILQLLPGTERAVRCSRRTDPQRPDGC